MGSSSARMAVFETEGVLDTGAIAKGRSREEVCEPNRTGIHVGGAHAGLHLPNALVMLIAWIATRRRARKRFMMIGESIERSLVANDKI